MTNGKQEVKMPLISVIVPAYNAELWIKECCESVFVQTYPNWELIVVDDGSKDKTPLILNELSLGRENMIVIHTPNGGVSYARNIGIDAAKGEYITFIDSDDYVTAQFLEEACALAESCKADMYISGICEEWIEDKKIIAKKQYSILKTTTYNAKRLLEQHDIEYSAMCLAVPFCKLIKRDVLKKHGIRFDTSMYKLEDTRFVYDVICQAERYVFDERVFYHYRNWSKNTLSKRFSKELPHCANECVRSINAALDIRKPNAEAMLRFKRLTMGMVLSSIQPYYNDCCRVSFYDRYNAIKELANNDVVQTYTLGHGLSWRQCIMVILLRMKIYFLADLIYGWVYRRKTA